MTTMMPNRPMELSDGGRTFTCATAPGVVFETEEEMKEHYRSDWHRQNLKRKIAGLAPLGRAAYEERATREREREQAGGGDVAGAAAGAANRSQARRLRREAKQQERAAKAATNPKSKAAQFEATRTMTEHEYIEHKMKTAEDFDEGSDLFSRHQSANLHANLAHMARTHGFYVPYLEYVTDLAGLIGYLLEMVYVGNVALISGKQFHSLEAVQGHMRDKGECRMELEGHEDEYAAYYDLDALATKSPLWQWVEEEESDGEEGEEGEEAAGAEQMALVAEEPAAAVAVAVGGSSGGSSGGGGALGGGDEMDEDDEDDELTRLFERCVHLGLLTEGEVDRLTDAVASGEATEALLVAEWSAKLARASGGGGGGGGDGASVAASSRGTVMRVRYRPLSGAAEGGTLAFHRESPGGGQMTTVEVGHRSLRTYYRQTYRPSSDPLGAANPELHALMLQYAQAGVLSAPLRRMGACAGPGGPKHERSHAQLQYDKKLYLRQGLTNNTTMNGMKHYKNQSLTF